MSSHEGIEDRASFGMKRTWSGSLAIWGISRTDFLSVFRRKENTVEDVIHQSSRGQRIPSRVDDSEDLRLFHAAYSQAVYQASDFRLRNFDTAEDRLIGRCSQQDCSPVDADLFCPGLVPDRDVSVEVVKERVGLHRRFGRGVHLHPLDDNEPLADPFGNANLGHQLADNRPDCSVLLLAVEAVCFSSGPVPVYRKFLWGYAEGSRRRLSGSCLSAVGSAESRTGFSNRSIHWTPKAVSWPTRLRSASSF